MVIRDVSPIIRDPFGLRDGTVQRVNLSVRGGGDRFSYFVAGDSDEQEGVFFNSFNNRRSVRANFSVQPAERLDFQISTNYVRNHLRLPIGDESAQGLLLGAVRGPAGRIPVREGIIPGYVFAVDGARANTYDNQTRSDRTTLGGTINYRPLDWFRNRLTLGLDLTSNQAVLLSPPGSTDADFAGVPEGQSALRIPRSRYYTVDYVGNVETGLTSWLQATTSFGTQFIARRTETLFGVGTGLGAPDITTIQNAAVTSGSNSFTENNSIGYYVQEQLAFRDRFFLTGALRADDNSSFGSQFDVIVYPKLSASWVVSEEPFATRLFDPLGLQQFKLRAAYGQAGRAPAPYSANQTYTVVKVATAGNTVSGLRSVTFGNPDLKPERGEEWEGGFEGALFGGRLGFDVTHYLKKTDNLLQAQSVAPSTGFIGTRLTNIGEIRNQGTELLLTATPVRRDAFSWESRLNFAANRNRLVKVNDQDQQSITATFQAYSTGLQVHRVGRPLASFYAAPALPDSFVVRAGVIYPVLDTIQYVGNPTPTREIGFGNTFTLFRNLQLFAQLDYKGGHKIFNYKEYDRCRFRGNCERLNDVRFIAPVSATDSAAARDISRYRGVGVLNNVLVTHWEPYIEPGDFLRLRDVSLTFTVPGRFMALTGASGASLTLAAANAAMLGPGIPGWTLR
jgi:outer membrane receptor protein involved in Fe transport